MLQMELVDRTAKKTTKVAISANGAFRAAPEWSPDGTRVAFVDGTRLRVVDPDTGEDALPVALKLGDSIPTLAWSPDGKTLAVGHGYLYHNAVSFIDAKSGKVRPTSLVDDGSPIRSLAWSERSDLLVCDARSPRLLDREGRAIFTAGSAVQVRFSALSPGSNEKTWQIMAVIGGAWAPLVTSGPEVNMPMPSFWAPRENQVAKVSTAGTWVAYQLDDRRVAVQRFGENPVEHTGTQVVDEIVSSGQGNWVLVRRSTAFTAIPVAPIRTAVTIGE